MSRRRAEPVSRDGARHVRRATVRPLVIGHCKWVQVPSGATTAGQDVSGGFGWVIDEHDTGFRFPGAAVDPYFRQFVSPADAVGGPDLGAKPAFLVSYPGEQR